jgi:hypothetical protein
LATNETIPPTLQQQEVLRVRGARVHNLKNITVEGGIGHIRLEQE